MEQAILLDAIKAAICAGEEILAIYNDPRQDFQIEQKADNSPLTIADRKAHEVISSYLQKTPYPILSEEGKKKPYEERSSWNVLWIVDPLDGTKEFIKRNGEFTVNIALVKEGVPTLGVIYVPVNRTLYFGESQLGAYKVEMTQSINELTWDVLLSRAYKLPMNCEHENFVIVASRSHLSPETEIYVDDMKQKYGAVKLISSGSSIKICLVAEGFADVYPRFAPTMEWDTAAGHAIASAAGMEIYRVEDGKEQNEPLTYNKKDLLNPWFIVKPVK